MTAAVAPKNPPSGMSIITYLRMSPADRLAAHREADRKHRQQMKVRPGIDPADRRKGEDTKANLKKTFGELLGEGSKIAVILMESIRAAKAIGVAGMMNFYENFKARFLAVINSDPKLANRSRVSPAFAAKLDGIMSKGIEPARAAEAQRMTEKKADDFDDFSDFVAPKPKPTAAPKKLAPLALKQVGIVYLAEKLAGKSESYHRNVTLQDKIDWFGDREKGKWVEKIAFGHASIDTNDLETKARAFLDERNRLARENQKQLKLALPEPVPVWNSDFEKKVDSLFADYIAQREAEEAFFAQRNTEKETDTDETENLPQSERLRRARQ